MKNDTVMFFFFVKLLDFELLWKRTRNCKKWKKSINREGYKNKAMKNIFYTRKTYRNGRKIENACEKILKYHVKYPIYIYAYLYHADFSSWFKRSATLGKQNHLN